MKKLSIVPVCSLALIVISFVSFAVEIPVDVPERGYVSLQILDAKGDVVGHAISPEPLEKGKRTVEWDMRATIDGSKLGTGEYTYRAVWIPEHTLTYRGCFYPTPLPDGQTPWHNARSGGGGWLADHFAPKSIVRVGEFMYITAMCEAAHGLIKCDKDLNKLWGTRQWVFNTPYTSAGEGDFYYGFKNGVKKVDSRDNKTSGVKTKAKGFSFAVMGGRAYFSDGDAVNVWDFSEKPDAVTDKPIDVIPVPKAGQIRKTPDGKLLLWSDKDVVRLDPATKEIKTVLKDAAENPGGLAVREDGVFAVGDCGKHIVTVYGRDLKPIRTLGKGGRRPVGEWDEDTLEDPFGIEFGPDGRLWICEQSQQPKRVGVWNIDTGHCEKSVVGPTNYGGGGTLDPDDANRAFWGYLELTKGADGKYRPARIFFRPGAEGCGPWGGVPTYAFRAKGRLWFTDQQNPMGNGGNILYLYEGGHARAVAAWGNANFLASKLAEFKGKNFAFSWTDLNDDGKITADECVIDERVTGLGTGWVNRVNENFEIAFGCDGSGVVKFSPVRFTEKGYPVYGHLGEPLHPPFVAAHHQGRFASSHLVDAKGNILTLSKPLMSIAPDGKVNFRYRNRWPSLHDSHETTESGRKLGELVGTTRFWGATKLNDDIGEIVCFNSNLGCAYLMTTDGIFLAQLMQDQRCGLHWSYAHFPDSDTLKKTSMQDEHFLGEFQRTKFDGRDALAIVCGKTHASIIEVGGLEGARRLKEGSFEVTKKGLLESAQRKADSLAKNYAPPVYTVKQINPPRGFGGGDEVSDALDDFVDDLDEDAPTPQVSLGRPPARVWNSGDLAKGAGGDFFRIFHDGRYLYFAYTCRENGSSMKNSGKDLTTLFETGGAIDLMLQTDAKAVPSRKSAARGDIRLLFAECGGKVVCVKYDYVNSKAPKSARVDFESDVAKTTVASITELKRVSAWVERSRGLFTLRAIVPLSSIAKKKLPAETRLDVGRITGDPSGAASVERSYWSNKATALMSDRPTQASVEPRLWGKVRFE